MAPAPSTPHTPMGAMALAGGAWREGGRWAGAAKAGPDRRVHGGGPDPESCPEARQGQGGLEGRQLDVICAGHA